MSSFQKHYLLALLASSFLLYRTCTREMSMSNNPWGMSHYDFWDPQSDRAREARYHEEKDVVAPPMFQEHVNSIVIGAPGPVGPNERETLPLISVFSQSNYHSWFHSYDDHGAILAINQETDELTYSGLAQYEEGAIQMRWEFDPDYDPGYGTSATFEKVNDLFRSNIPRKPGTWLVRVVLGDLISNTVKVTIKGKPKKLPRNSFTITNLKSPSAGYPDSLSYPDTQNDVPPTQFGIQIGAPPIITSANLQEAKIIIRFAVPVQERYLLDEPTDLIVAAVPIHIWSEGAQVVPRTRIPETQIPEHAIIPARILSAPIDGQQALYGVLEVNVAKAKRYTEKPYVDQEAYFYAFVGEYSTGPVTVQFGEKSSLPPKP